MKQKLKKKIVVLSGLAVAFAATAIAGYFLRGEVLLAVGIAPGFLCLLFIPALIQSDKRAARRLKPNPLASWIYSFDEAELVAQQVIAGTAKRRRGFTILLSVCLLLLVLPFFFILSASEPEAPSYVFALLVCAPLLPWLVLLVTPAFIRGRVLRAPTVTVIAHDSIVIGNTVHYLNNREELQLVGARFIPAQDGLAQLQLDYKNAYRIKSSGLIWRKDTVSVPVPAYEEANAKALAESFHKPK